MNFNIDTGVFDNRDRNCDKLAISGSDGDISWSEFELLVNEKITYLNDINIPKGHPVLIYGHKEVEFVVLITACIALSLPYIPVDSVYPHERMLQIAEISQSGILFDLINNEISINADRFITTYDFDSPLVYILFTSGSTGAPKGVQITKDSIIDFSNWIGEEFLLSEGSIFMNQAPFSFDLSVYELIGFLSYGGSLILNEKSLTASPEKFLKRIKDYSCNTWISTPSFINVQLMNKNFEKDLLPCLEKFIFCGEILPVSVCKKIFKKFTTAKIFNSYGPTEATVATTALLITENILEYYPKDLPVGFVKPRSQIRILNENLDGVGEIQILGPNVSVGYLNNSNLNDLKFGVQDDFRFFNTGDYGVLKGKLLFFKQRKDDLIKLHGYRIEIGEIDSSILSTDFVDMSVTIPIYRNGQVLKLITFVVGLELHVDKLKELIMKKLPSYMCPSEVIEIQKLPTNKNGKVDKAKLIQSYKEGMFDF